MDLLLQSLSGANTAERFVTDGANKVYVTL